MCIGKPFGGEKDGKNETKLADGLTSNRRTQHRPNERQQSETQKEEMARERQ